MPLINIDLYDGKKPVSFALTGDDSQRLQAFMQRYSELENAGKALAESHPETIAALYRDGEPVGQQFLDLVAAG